VEGEMSEQFEGGREGRGERGHATARELC